MTPGQLNRLALVAALLAAAYALALLQPVRNGYSDVDKLAHGLVFAGVYLALAWALRWRPWAVALLALALGGAVELHQRYFLVAYTGSLTDWLVDAVGIALAWGVHALWRWARRAPGAEPGSAALLPPAQFEAAVAALPLVSVDWVLSDPAGAVLCGLRLNAPARGAWFTPGGRVHKGEAMAAALQRVAMSELGAPAAMAADWVARAQPMGAWDHFYEDSAFSATAPTHYVNLPYALALSWPEVEALNETLPLGEQHSAWRWMPANSAESIGLVHRHVAPYLAWVAKGLPAVIETKGVTP